MRMNIDVLRVIRGGNFHNFGAALTLVNDSSVKGLELQLYKVFSSVRMAGLYCCPMALNKSDNLTIAGPISTISSAGKINNNKGKINLIAALATSSSARWR